MWGNVECLPGAGSQRRIADVLNSDGELVERCLSEDEAAWEYLVRQHTGRVYGMCYSFTRRRSDAQDLTQDVFLRVFQHARQLPLRRSLLHKLAGPPHSQPPYR